MDLLDKIENTKKYIKYLILIIPLVLIILLFKGCNGTNYKGIEKTLEKEALSFVKENNINITGEKYIEISLLEEVEGTELCSKASGVLVKNVNGKLEASAYLNCPDYESEIIDNKNKYIELNDGDVIVLNVGEIFKDPLYTLKKAAEVKVQGSVGTNPGIYTLYYQAYVSGKLKETVTRKVIRSSADKTTNISGIEDTSRPTITLMGDKNIVLNIGSKYKEPGYLAVDYKDGKITRQVEVSGSVDTNREGKYTITYTVENSRGMSTLESRIITVVRFKADLDITLTVEDKELTNKTNVIFNVKGDGYRYTKLPNGNVISDTNYKFEVTKNGTYSVEVYDRYDNKFVKEIEITNIDDEAPTGSCKAIVSSSKTIVEVNAFDNKGIAGYDYILNGSGTGFQTANTYQANIKSESVKVKVKDVSENEATLTCDIEEKNIIAAGMCKNKGVKVNIKECWGNGTIRSNVDLEEYLIGVLFGEEHPSVSELQNNMEFIKAFVIYARTFALNRGGYSKSKTLSLKSCSSDQNWCDYKQGCYREQTQAMFDDCIVFALNHRGSNGLPTYTAETCANRVTTYPGTKQVSKSVFHVTNPAWPSSMASSALSTHTTSKWHGAANAAYQELIRKAVLETEGLVLKDKNGKLASVGYYLCDNTTSPSVMCPNIAVKMGENGATAEEIITAYAQRYPDFIIDCY